ncbi:MAG: Nramp family divalent metal transporter [Planctomycetaceae bacterium]
MTEARSDDLVPDSVIPHHNLPPLRYRDLPEPVAWRTMVGPSVMLAGLALGSGEFVFWPHVVYRTGFVFYWACMLGVITQFFVNMEIERWTLATGESAITGFCRLSKTWGPVMLVLNIVPWAWPGWGTGAASMMSWLVFGPLEVVKEGVTTYEARYVREISIALLVLVGIVLTTGPVVYNTVERLQKFLVTIIVVIAIVIGCVVIRGDAFVAMIAGVRNVGTMPDLGESGLTMMQLLGALAFAGAGGTMNLGQSHFIKDKGYGMGKYIGRITSPLTGQEEPIADVGYHFPHTPENMRRWKQWWRAANIEHFMSFYLTCVVCLCLLALISYSLFRDETGALKPGMDRFGSGMSFVWGESTLIGEARFGSLLKPAFFIMGIALLFTTELGVLDVVARISTDIVKVNYLRENSAWSQGRLYYCFLWGEIALGTIILLQPVFSEPMVLLKISAAMNGAVMFLYSLVLLYMNNKVLSRSLSMSPLRFVAVVWSCAFFGYFSLQALRIELLPLLFGGK